MKKKDCVCIEAAKWARNRKYMRWMHPWRSKNNHIICKMPKNSSATEQLGVQVKNSTCYDVVLPFSSIFFVYINLNTIHVWIWNKGTVCNCIGYSRHFHNKPVEIKTKRQCATEKWFIVNKLIGNFIIKYFFSVITDFWFPFLCFFFALLHQFLYVVKWNFVYFFSVTLLKHHVNMYI